MGSDPLRRASNKSGFSDLRDRSLLSRCHTSWPSASCAHTVSGPPELRRRSCFFRRLALPFRLVCRVSRSLRSPATGIVRVNGESAGAEPRRGHWRSKYVSTCDGTILLLSAVSWPAWFLSFSGLTVNISSHHWISSNNFQLHFILTIKRLSSKEC